MTGVLTLAVSVVLVAPGLLSAARADAAPPDRPRGLDDGARAGPRWSWPVASPHPVLTPYAAPATPYSAGHRGIDVGAPRGAAVRAPADGTVHFAGVVVDRPLISLDLGGGVLASVEPVAPEVARGESVRRGQVIGRLQPGHCPRRTCLHLGARVDGEYVSPLLMLGDVPRAVLLPMRE